MTDAGVACSVTKLNSSGAALTPGMVGITGLNLRYGIAIDASGGALATNLGNNTVTKLVGAAAPIRTPLVATITAGQGFTPQARPCALRQVLTETPAYRATGRGVTDKGNKMISYKKTFWAMRAIHAAGLSILFSSAPVFARLHGRADSPENPNWIPWLRRRGSMPGA